MIFVSWTHHNDKVLPVWLKVKSFCFQVALFSNHRHARKRIWLPITCCIYRKKKFIIFCYTLSFGLVGFCFVDVNLSLFIWKTSHLGNAKRERQVIMSPAGKENNIIMSCCWAAAVLSACWRLFYWTNLMFGLQFCSCVPHCPCCWVLSGGDGNQVYFLAINFWTHLFIWFRFI